MADVGPVCWDLGAHFHCHWLGMVQAVGRRVDGYFAREQGGASGQLVVIGFAGLDADAIADRLGGKVIAGHASS